MGFVSLGSSVSLVYGQLSIIIPACLAWDTVSGDAGKGVGPLVDE